MNSIAFIKLLRLRWLLLLQLFLFSQYAYSQLQTSGVISSGGGLSVGGNYKNFSVVGAEPVAANILGGNYSAKVGFIYNSLQTISGIPYNLNVVSSPIEAGTVTGSGLYYTGTSIPLTAVADNGWTFIGWSSVAGSFTSVNSPTSNFVMPNENVQVIAHFELDNVTPTLYTLTLSVAPAESGEVSGSGDYVSGAMVSVFALPANGYRFLSWKEGAVIVSTDPNYSFAISRNRNLVAHFAPQLHTISLQSLPLNNIGGSAIGSGLYQHGTEVTVRANPNVGFTFEGWFEEGSLVSTDANYTFEVTENRYLSASYSGDLYEITTVASEEEGRVSGSGSYYFGDIVTLSATPAPGLYFVRWMEGTSQVSVRNPYVFSASESRIITAEFASDWNTKEVTYLITSSVTPSSVGVVLGQGNYAEGQEVTLIASPNEGINFVKWMEEGVDIVDSESNLVGSTYTFISASNRSLVAVFDGAILEVTVESNPSIAGEVSISNDGEFFLGDLATVSAIANAGYKFVNWTLGVDGPQLSVNSNYSFTVNESRQLVANFEEVSQFTLTLNVFPEGTGVVNGGGMYYAGTDVSIEATPNEGYSFEYWSNGAELVSTNALTEVNLISNLEIEAYFTLNSYTLSYAADEGGTITGSLSQTVNHGDDGTPVTAVPNSGYNFVKWSDDVTDNPRTDVNVTEDITVTAEFAQSLYNVSFWISDGMQPIVGATITVNDQALTSNSEGLVLIQLVNGTYEFSVTADGFELFSGEVVVNNLELEVDVFLQPLSIESNVLTSKFNVFPNPFSSTLNIDANFKVRRLVISNIIGKVVYELKLPDLQQVSVELPQLVSGSYSVILIGASGEKTSKLVIKL
jgi:hypothetical protein